MTDRTIDNNTGAETTGAERFRLPPDLSALEARIGQFQPKLDDNRLREIKTVVLLERCRLLEESATPATRREQLIETFKRAEKEEISLSLNQFLKSVRWTSTLTGAVVGFILGTLATFAGIYMTVHYLSPEIEPVKPPMENRGFYDLRYDMTDLSLYPGQNPQNSLQAEKEPNNERP